MRLASHKKPVKMIGLAAVILFAVNCAFAISVDIGSLTYKRPFHIINKGENVASDSAVVSNGTNVSVVCSGPSWVTFSPAEFSLTSEGGGGSETVTIGYDTSDMDPGVYTGTVTFTPFDPGGAARSFAVSIKIVDPEIYIWTWDPADNASAEREFNEDLVFDRPQGTSSNVGSTSWSNPPVIEAFCSWAGQGVPYQFDTMFLSDFFNKRQTPTSHFRIWNTGVGDLQYRVESIVYEDNPPWNWISTITGITPTGGEHVLTTGGGTSSAWSEAKIIHDRFEAGNIDYSYTNFYFPYSNSSQISEAAYNSLPADQKAFYQPFVYQGTTYYRDPLDPFALPIYSPDAANVPWIDAPSSKVVSKAGTMIGNFVTLNFGYMAPINLNSAATLPAGTYKATVTLDARSYDTEGQARYATLEIIVVLRVGTKAQIVSPTLMVLPPNADTGYDDFGDSHIVIWEYGTGSDPSGWDLSVNLGSAGGDDYRPTNCQDNTGQPPGSDHNSSSNPTKLYYHVSKMGDAADPDAAWLKVGKEEGIVDYLRYSTSMPAGLKGGYATFHSDSVPVSFDTSDLYPGGYTATMYIHGNDGFGQNTSNSTFAFDTTNPDAQPTMNADTLRDGNLCEITLLIVGPTIGLSTNAVAEVLDFADIVKDGAGVIQGHDIFIWNRYSGYGKLHYTYSITGPAGAAADWLSIRIRDYGVNITGAGDSDTNGLYAYYATDFNGKRIFYKTTDYGTENPIIHALWYADADQGWVIGDAKTSTVFYKNKIDSFLGNFEVVNGTSPAPSAARITDENQIAGPYDDGSKPGVDNRDIIELYYDTTAMVPGNYEATITIEGDKTPEGREICENSPQFIHINVRVLGPEIATDVSDLKPVSAVGGNPENENEFLVWNADQPSSSVGHEQTTLNYTITTSESWLTCTNTDPDYIGQAAGDSNGPSDQDKILVSYTTTGLAAGTHTATITITDELTGNTRDIDVTLTTIAPIIATSTQEINVIENFGTDPKAVEFELWNADTFGTDLYYNLSSTGSWMTLTDNKGAPLISTGPQDRRTVTVNFDVSGLAPGKYTGQITITGINAVLAKVITVNLEIKASTVTVYPTSLFPTCLKGNNAEGGDPFDFEVWNGAYSILNYSITVEYTDDSGSTDWLSCDPTSGSSEDATDRQKIAITYSTDKLPAGTYTANILVSDPNSSNTSETISVTLVVQEPQISLSKTEITQSCDFGRNASTNTFQVWNSATGDLYYEASHDGVYDNDGTDITWLGVLLPDPALSTGEKDTITVGYASATLPIGTYTATITISGYMDEAKTLPTTPSTATIAVTLKVGAVIGLTVNELNPSCYQGTNAESTTFKVYNAGVSGTKLSYTITEAIDWLELSPKTGESEGEKDTISVTYNTRSLVTDLYTGKITVSNDNEPSDVQEIIVTLAVKSGAVIATDLASIDVSCGQGNSPDPASLQIWNSGKGTLDFSIEAKDADYDPAVATAWITKIDPATGTSASISEIKTSAITFDTTALTTGTYKAVLTITDPLSENTPYTVTVNLSILGPTISVDPSTISATAEAGGTDTQTFQVWNSGGGTLAYTLADNAEWLTLDITSGDSTGADDKDTITATCSAADLSAGTYEATITVTSATEGITNSPQTIIVTFGVGMPEVASSVSKLSPKATSGTDAPEESFEVWNSSAGTLDYKVSVDVAWLAVSPTSGDSTGESDKDELTVTYNTDELAVGNYEGKITITDANAINSPFAIPVTLTVSDEVPDTGLLIQLAASGEGLTKDDENRVSFWPNEVNTGKVNNAQQRQLKQQPVYVSDLLNGNSALYFDSGQNMEISLIETTGVNARTISMVFRTGGDISTRQLLFEQGDENYGFNFYIENKTFYANAWNLTNAGGLTQWGPVSMTTQILGYQTYYATLVFDPDNTQVMAYLNGDSLGSGVANKMFFPNMEYISLGSDVNGTKFPSDTKKKKTRSKGLTGYIAEFLYYNEAISESTRLNLDSYFQAKYNVTETDIRINDLALWLRADYDTLVIDDGMVKEWKDRADSSKKGISFKMGSKKKRPAYTENVVNNNAGVTFDGLATYMKTKNHVNLNSSKTPYSSRSMFVVFKTGADVTTRQVIWTEGFKKSGVNIYLESGQLYMGAWGTKAPKGEIPWSAVFVSASGITANTVYCAQFNLDATSGMEGFLNGGSIGSSTSVGKLFKHKAATLGAVKSGSILNGGIEVKKGDFLNGTVLEMLIYNAILSDTEVLTTENYLKDRYGIAFE